MSRWMVAGVAWSLLAGVAGAQVEPPPEAMQGWRRVLPTDPENVVPRLVWEVRSGRLTDERARELALDVLRRRSIPDTRWYLWGRIATALRDTGRFPPDLQAKFIQRMPELEWPVKSEIPARSVWPCIVVLRFRGFPFPEPPTRYQSSRALEIKAVRGPFIEGELLPGERKWTNSGSGAGNGEASATIVGETPWGATWTAPARIELEPDRAYRVRFEVDWAIDPEKDLDDFYARHVELGLRTSGAATVERTVRITAPRTPSEPIVDAAPMRAWLSSLAWRVRRSAGQPILSVTQVHVTETGEAESRPMPPLPSSVAFRVSLRHGERRWELGPWVCNRLRNRPFGPWLAVPEDAASIIATAKVGEVKIVFAPFEDAVADTCLDGEAVYGGVPIEVDAPVGPLSELKTYSIMGGGGLTWPTEPYGPAYVKSWESQRADR